MITKGIVDQIIDDYRVTVKIPRINASFYELDGTLGDSYEATICTLPNTAMNLKKGSIVYLGFEDNDLSSPVVLGAFLYQNQDKTVASALSMSDVSVRGTAELPTATSIGEVTSTELSYLSGTKDNIQVQLNNLNDKIDNTGGGEGGTSDYSQLANKPQINSVVLNGNVSLDSLGVAQKSDIPTKLSDLNQDATHRVVTDTEKSTWSGKQDKITITNKLPYSYISETPTIPNEVTESTVSGWGFTKNTGTYIKPNSGIPADDLSESVQSSLNKADSSIQSLDGYATEDFVNSSIATNTAYFRGTFNSVAELQAYSGEKTNNDYAFVVIYDSVVTTQVKQYDRYKYNGSSWEFEFTLNNSTFTQVQWNALNSGITADKVSAFTNKQDKITATNKLSYSLLSGTPTIPTNVSDLANDSGFITSDYHDSTKQNSLTQAQLNAVNSGITNAKRIQYDNYALTKQDTIVDLDDMRNDIAENHDNITLLGESFESAVEDVYNQLNGKVDAVDGKGLSTNDFTNTYKSNVDSNTTARHTHSNKSVLDAISGTETATEVETVEAETIDVDTVVTSGSNYLITSGAVYSYIQSLNASGVKY